MEKAFPFDTENFQNLQLKIWAKWKVPLVLLTSGKTSLDVVGRTPDVIVPGFHQPDVGEFLLRPTYYRL